MISISLSFCGWKKCPEAYVPGHCVKKTKSLLGGQLVQCFGQSCINDLVVHLSLYALHLRQYILHQPLGNPQSLLRVKCSKVLRHPARILIFGQQGRNRLLARCRSLVRRTLNASASLLASHLSPPLFLAIHASSHSINATADIVAATIIICNVWLECLTCAIGPDLLRAVRVVSVKATVRHTVSVRIHVLSLQCVTSRLIHTVSPLTSIPTNTESLVVTVSLTVLARHIVSVFSTLRSTATGLSAPHPASRATPAASMDNASSRFRIFSQ